MSVSTMTFRGVSNIEVHFLIWLVEKVKYEFRCCQIAANMSRFSMAVKYGND